MEVQPKDTSRGHFYVSMAKSMLRIGASLALMLMSGVFAIAGCLLFVAELLGILEELV
jgi:hypothetical protein